MSARPRAAIVGGRSSSQTARHWELSITDARIKLAKTGRPFSLSRVGTRIRGSTEHVKTSCAAATICPRPFMLVILTATQTELSVWSSRVSVQIFVLHPYTKFEFRVPSRSEDNADFRSRR